MGIQQPQIISQPQVIQQPQVISQPQVIQQPRVMQYQEIAQPQVISQPQVINSRSYVDVPASNYSQFGVIGQTNPAAYSSGYVMPANTYTTTGGGRDYTASQLFNAIDTNHDGKISRAEMAGWR